MTTFTITSAIICLIIVLLTMLSMYNVSTYYGNEGERIKLPLYVYIIAVIVCIIPILNILATIVYIAFCIWDDDLTIKGPVGKIIKFLSKPV